MKGFHVMTSLAYWVNRIQIKVILTALFVFERRDTISTETILASTKCPYSPYTILSIVQGTRFPFPLSNGLYLVRDHVHQRLFCCELYSVFRPNQIHCI